MRSTPGQDRPALLVCDCDGCSRGRGWGGRAGGCGRGRRAVQGVHLGRTDMHHEFVILMIAAEVKAGGWGGRMVDMEGDREQHDENTWARQTHIISL